MKDIERRVMAANRDALQKAAQEAAQKAAEMNTNTR